jgi:valyl-tRNA synthetase
VLYAFIWNDVCDVYVEAAKARLYGDDEEARREASATLLWVLERMLALAHPVMPFITEEIWSYMSGDRDLLMASPFPSVEGVARDVPLERQAEAAMAAISEARRLAGEGQDVEVTIPPGFPFRSLLEKEKRVHVVESPEATAPIVAAQADRATWEARLTVVRSELERARGKLSNDGFLSRAPADLVDAEREKASRFEAEAAELESRLSA